MRELLVALAFGLAGIGVGTASDHAPAFVGIGSA